MHILVHPRVSSQVNQWLKITWIKVLLFGLLNNTITVYGVNNARLWIPISAVWDLQCTDKLHCGFLELFPYNALGQVFPCTSRKPKSDKLLKILGVV